ncbi:hypothetical protein V8E51_002354 [Hyaloscypha variabilis]|jgi:hypothetical protein
MAREKVAAEARRVLSQTEGQNPQSTEKNKKVSGTEGVGKQGRAQAEMKEGQVWWFDTVGNVVVNIVVYTIGFIAMLIVEMFL